MWINGYYMANRWLSNGWVLVPNPKDLNEKVTISTEKLFLLVLIEKWYYFYYNIIIINIILLLILSLI